MKVALVTGIVGQDGYYLARLLLSKGYEIVGVTHRAESMPAAPGGLASVSTIRGDVTKRDEIAKIVTGVRPDEIYNLAGFSFPPSSLGRPDEAFRVNTLGAFNVLEAARLLSETKSDVRLYQASTSEMFGRSQQPPHDETTALRPETPYAASKAAAHHLVASYRESFGMYAVSGILFNHESEFRPPHYVTRKVSLAAAQISLGLTDSVTLGDLSATRDWGAAQDYVEGMWLMMQQPLPDDYVLATGVGHSVEDLVKTAFQVVGIKDWQDHVEVAPELVRPPEKNPPIGNPGKAARMLGWQPKIGFEELVRTMVDADVRRSLPD